MTQLEKKAVQLRDEAAKKLSCKGFFQSLFGPNRTDQAIEYYQRSANLFKMAKNWKEAGTILHEIGELHNKRCEDFEAATSFINAANCFKRCDGEEAIRNLTKAIAIYTNIGKFSLAAKYHKIIADLYENQEMDMDKALEHYEQAAEFFQYEDSFAQSKTCLLKIAEHAALSENYQKAIPIFKQIYEYELGQSLLKYNAKDHFMQALLCQLCVDETVIPQMLDDFLKTCPFFIGSREHKLLTSIFQSMQDHDTEQFNNSVADYDSISRFSTWYVTVLLRIKRRVEDIPDLK